MNDLGPSDFKPGDICVFTAQSIAADTGRVTEIRYDVMVMIEPYKDYYGTWRTDVRMWDGKKGTGYRQNAALTSLRKK
jgi:hypothetical protein